MAEEEQAEQLPPPRQKTREPSQEETATLIADALGEQGIEQRQQLMNIVRALGRTQARAMLQETLDIESSGGMMLPDGSRRRTPGGVYFHLAYTKGQPKEGKKLFRPAYRRPGVAERSAGTSPVPTPQPVIVFTWEDRIAVIREAEQQKGNANVKMTLVGRPGKIVDRGSAIVTVMESTKIPALPKGVPTPAHVATKYTVYIASKQWKKVADAIQNPEDALILEGFPMMDAQTGSIAVFVTSATTKHLQQAQRDAQKAQPASSA